MMTSSSARLVAVTLLFLILALFGCGEDESARRNEAGRTETPHRGGVYRSPLLNEPPALDPPQVRDIYGEQIVFQIFDCLISFDHLLMIRPALAETWQVSDEGRTYRFHLRRNAHFHNGRAVTAGDVVFSLRRLLRTEPAPGPLPSILAIEGAPAYRRGETDTVTGLAAENDHTVLVRLSEPHAPFLAALGACHSAILPEAEVTAQGPGFGRHPIGSGPFKFVEWEPGQRIRLAAFQEYHSGAPHLDGVEFLLYPGGSTDRVLADFKAGILSEMPVYGTIRQELAGRQDLQWLERPTLTLLFYGIRQDHPVLADPLLRRALARAIDRDQLLAQVYNGQFEKALAILPPGMPGYHPPAAAAKTASAPIPQADRLPPIEIVSATRSAFSEAELAFVRDAWEKLGLKVTIKYITDWRQFEEYLRSDALQIYRYAWSPDSPDPDSILSPLFASGYRTNFTRFSSPEVDRLLQDARREPDPVRRAALCQQIEQAIMEQAPIIPLFYLNASLVLQPNVRDLKLNAMGRQSISLGRVWLKP